MATGKKRKIRKMRTSAKKNADGKSESSHLMVWGGDPSKKRKGDFAVYPTIRPKKGKESSTNAADWEEQSWKEAIARNEYIPVKKRKTAIKLAQGTWKKDKKSRKKARKNARAENKTYKK